MAKSRSRLRRPNNGQRSPNVCVSSSPSSCSSEEDSDFVIKREGKTSDSDSRKSLSWTSRSSSMLSKGIDNVSASYAEKQGRRLGVGLRPKDNNGGKYVDSGFEPIKGNRSGAFKRKWTDEYQVNSYSMQSKCFSRNAVMARLNRMKKKKYLESLESNVSNLTEENEALKDTVDRQKENMKGLKNRVRYLESVLANSHEIGLLLKNIQNATGLPTVNTLQQKIMEQNSLSEPFKAAHNGFPPPQPDHIYSKTPSVESGKEDSPFLGDPTTKQEDFPLTWLSDDNCPPYVSSDDLFDPSLPLSDDMFDLGGDDQLLPDVGICLHVAKKRVSLEFCSSCNDSATDAWAQSILDASLV